MIHFLGNVVMFWRSAENKQKGRLVILQALLCERIMNLWSSPKRMIMHWHRTRKSFLFEKAFLLRYYFIMPLYKFPVCIRINQKLLRRYLFSFSPEQWEKETSRKS